MPYVAPSTVTTLQTYTSAAHNIIVNDIIDLDTRVNDTGLAIVTPTSVSGSGVSSSNGAITLTAATAPIINGVFTSAYENYKIVFSNVSGSTSQLFSLRMSSGGTPASGATDYAYSLIQSASAGAWLNLDFSSGTSLIALGYKVNGGKSAVNIEAYAPALSVATEFTASGVYLGTPFVGGGFHNVASAYDGFAVIPASGNITATVRVYGYQNS